MVKVLENVFRGIIFSFAVNNWSNLWRMMLALFPAAIFVLLGGGYSNECTSWLFSQDASECLEQKGIEEIMLFSREFWPALTTVNPHTRYPTNTRDFQPVTISQTLFSSSIFPPRSTIWTRGTVHSDHDVATDVWRKRKIQYVWCKLKRGRWHEQNARSPCDFSLNFVSLAIFEFQKSHFQNSVINLTYFWNDSWVQTFHVLSVSTVKILVGTSLHLPHR